MTESKPKAADSMRSPKPKKKLGLTVPPALRLPHDDLINSSAKPRVEETSSHNQQTRSATPVATTVNTLVATGVVHQINEAKERDQVRYLDATHSASEARVFSVMYRETISKGVRERHFGPKELCEKTGIRSDRTVRTALHGLVDKLSVEVVSNANGNPLGPRYRVLEPKEIMRRRKAVGMEIDPQSKRIIHVPPSPPTPVTTAVDTGGENYPGSEAKTTPVTPVNFAGVYTKYRNSDLAESGFTAPSSSESLSDSDDNAVLLDSIKEVYERATGNQWTTADALVAQKGRDIPADVWGVAICYCVDRAPGHKFDRLAYVAAQAREHAEAMKDYSPSDLRAILRHSLRIIERARREGKWSLNEFTEE